MILCDVRIGQKLGDVFIKSFKYRAQVNDDSDEENVTEEERAARESRAQKRRSVDVVKFRYQTSPTLVDCGIKTVDIKLEGRLIRKIWTS